jgi:hypothetical protein
MHCLLDYAHGRLISVDVLMENGLSQQARLEFVGGSASTAHLELEFDLLLVCHGLKAMGSARTT